MFTGIVEEKGKVKAIRAGANSSVLTISASCIMDDVELGHSIAVNGVCLTVTSCTADQFTADVMHETLNRSSLGDLKVSSSVNLERAMAANGRFGGHIVSGHIDGTGTITKIQKDDNAFWFTIKTTDKIMRYIIEKGSITIDGISLTVAKVGQDNFSVSIIPHTMSVTTLGERKIGDTVNLENDCIGKYVEKLMQKEEVPTGSASGITKDFLAKYGF
ncbi:MAG: riboflavin synthase [Clostridiales bacterium]|nr:riboflavin synthase [Clostridiales bacterium]